MFQERKGKCDYVPVGKPGWFPAAFVEPVAPPPPTPKSSKIFQGNAGTAILTKEQDVTNDSSKKTPNDHTDTSEMRFSLDSSAVEKSSRQDSSKAIKKIEHKNGALALS